MSKEKDAFSNHEQSFDQEGLREIANERYKELASEREKTIEKKENIEGNIVSLFETNNIILINITLTITNKTLNILYHLICLFKHFFWNSSFPTWICTRYIYRDILNE